MPCMWWPHRILKLRVDVGWGGVRSVWQFKQLNHEIINMYTTVSSRHMTGEYLQHGDARTAYRAWHRATRHIMRAQKLLQYEDSSQNAFGGGKTHVVARKRRNRDIHETGSSLSELLSGTHPLAKQMKLYIATPYCECSLESGQMKFRDCHECGVYDNYPAQSHGGNLFEHSQWSALNIARWFTEDNSQSYQKLNDLTKQTCQHVNQIVGAKGINGIEFLMACAFFHDIGKGGDDIYDMYSNVKYQGKGDAHHPVVCRDAILTPGKLYDGLLKSTLRTVLSDLASDVSLARKILALCADMHWEFGKLNIPREFGGITADIYIGKIEQSMQDLMPHLVHGKDFEHIVNLCMVISCSDIAAASSEELKSTYTSPATGKVIAAAKNNYKSNGGAWVQFNMNTRHVELIGKVQKALVVRAQKGHTHRGTAG